MKKQAQLLLKMEGKDYEEYLFNIHKEIVVNGQELILKSLEKEAKRQEKEKQLKSDGGQ